MVCGCRGTESRRARVGRHKLVGQGILVAGVSAAYSLVAVEALAAWLGSPATKYLLSADTKKKRGRASLDVSRRKICRPVLGV